MKLNKPAMARRDRVETGLIRCTAARKRLELITLRCRQAVQRSPGLEDLLQPAIEDLDQVQAEISEMRSIFRQVWAEGEDQRWESTDG